MSACLLSLSVMSLLLPVSRSALCHSNRAVFDGFLTDSFQQTAFHASWSNDESADRFTLKVSRGTSIVRITKLGS